MGTIHTGHENQERDNIYKLASLGERKLLVRA